jgi:hypothetical protein
MKPQNIVVVIQVLLKAFREFCMRKEKPLNSANCSFSR